MVDDGSLVWHCDAFCLGLRVYDHGMCRSPVEDHVECKTAGSFFAETAKFQTQCAENGEDL